MGKMPDFAGISHEAADDSPGPSFSHPAVFADKRYWTLADRRLPMSQINPFGFYFSGSTQVQRLQAADKDQQVRQMEDRAKVTGLEDEELEHQVESSEEVAPIHDEPFQQQNSRHPMHHRREGDDGDEKDSDGPARLDITA